ncbi:MULTISPECIES: flavin reductase family protein [unclassified Streptomyces]|uniref:flavin reductase family protein n=1 Tax=unclassified Streptomyces TaxID=2593676 RepID=UPI00190616D3|nr:flavin reductase family protein [Streptomyces sp. HSG2]
MRAWSPAGRPTTPAGRTTPAARAQPSAPPGTEPGRAGRPAGTDPPEYGDPVAARTALRRLTSAVTVLTVDGGDGDRHGTTAGSVVAISREPLVLGVALRPGSAFVRLVLRTGTFSVNVLAVGQGEAARRFADPGRSPGDAQFANVAWRADPFSGAPLLDGALAHLSCRMLDRRPVGDHDLLLAEVTGGAPAPGAPLLSFSGRLGAVETV